MPAATDIVTKSRRERSPKEPLPASYSRFSSVMVLLGNLVYRGGMELLCRSYRLDLDGFCFRVEGACDGYLLSSELFRRLLIAQRVGFLLVIKNIQSAVRADA